MALLLNWCPGFPFITVALISLFFLLPLCSNYLGSSFFFFFFLVTRTKPDPFALFFLSLQSDHEGFESDPTSPDQKAANVSTPTAPVTSSAPSLPKPRTTTQQTPVPPVKSAIPTMDTNASKVIAQAAMQSALVSERRRLMFVWWRTNLSLSLSFSYCSATLFSGKTLRLSVLIVKSLSVVCLLMSVKTI